MNACFLMFCVFSCLCFVYGLLIVAYRWPPCMVVRCRLLLSVLLWWLHECLFHNVLCVFMFMFRIWSSNCGI